MPKPKKNKVSARQVLYLFFSFILTVILSFPFLNLPPEDYHVLWVVPLVLIFPLLFFFFFLTNFYKVCEEKAFFDILHDFGGIFLSKLMGVLLFLWLFLALLIHFTRIVSLASFLLPGISFTFCAVVLISLSLIVAIAGITPLSRMTEIIFPISVGILILSLVLLAPSFDFSLLLPVTLKNLPTAGNAFLRYSGTLLLFGVLFFFGNFINDKTNLVHQAKKSGILIFVLSSLVFFATSFTLGSHLSSSLPTPYITSTRLISVLGLFEKMDIALLFTLLLCAFTLFSFLLFSMITLSKAAFKANINHFLMVPAAVLITYLSESLSKHKELFVFLEERILFPANFIFGLFIPIIVFCTLFIKKRAKAKKS